VSGWVWRLLKADRKRKGLEIGRAIFGDEHPPTGRPYHYICVLYREKGDWENALLNFQKACRNWLPAYGLYHGDMVASYNNQGKALMNLGRYEEAHDSLFSDMTAGWRRCGKWYW